MKWITKSEEQGFATAQYDLGVLYDAGEGVAKDVDKAADWFTKAAEQGVARAQYNLGIYYKGLGAEQNYEQAAIWQ